VRGLRGYLEELEENGHVVHVRAPVDIKHELASVQWTIEKNRGRAVVFDNVNGYDCAVVGNLFLIPFRMGITPTLPWTDDLLNLIQGIKKPGIVYPLWATNDLFMPIFRQVESVVLAGLRQPLTPVRAEAAPRRVLTGDAVDLMAELPAPHYYREDGGHYLTAAVMSARDPQSGRINAGIYRIQVAGPRRLIAMVNLKRDLYSFLTRAKRLEQALEVTISIGVPPALMIASTMSVPSDLSEFDVAGGLAGHPLTVAHAHTVDLPVPADAEIVIEGRIEPGTRVTEGPFTEYDMLASQRSNGFPIEVTCVQVRERALFHSLVCPSQEMLSVIMCLGITEMLHARNLLAMITPNLKDLWLLPGVSGVGLVVSLYKEHEAEPQEVVHALFAFSARFKRIIVVDDDIDIHDPYDVQWAVDTRVAYDRDVMVLSATGEYTDPARIGDFSLKVGIDATRKAGHPNRFIRTDVRQFECDLSRYLDA
jgi:2,5-furandicarboxylate decarboxylase 1